MGDSSSSNGLWCIQIVVAMETFDEFLTQGFSFRSSVQGIFRSHKLLNMLFLLTENTLKSEKYERLGKRYD